MDKKQENVAVESEVETTTQAESPQVEVPTTEEQTVTEQIDQSEQQQVSDVESVELKDPREFQIKRLAEENRRLKSEKQNSAFDAFRPQVPAVSNQQVDVRNYTDEYGSIDYNAYNAELVKNAQQVAKIEAANTVNELLDENNARSKHPELFADPDIEQEIADRWIAAKLRGEEITISDVANRVATRYHKDVSKAEKRGAEKILQEVSVKEQAGLSASGQTSQGSRAAQSDENQAVLEAETRVGNQDAIVARLKNIPWANK